MDEASGEDSRVSKFYFERYRVIELTRFLLIISSLVLAALQVTKNLNYLSVRIRILFLPRVELRNRYIYVVYLDSFLMYTCF